MYKIWFGKGPRYVLGSYEPSRDMRPRPKMQALKEKEQNLQTKAQKLQAKEQRLQEMEQLLEAEKRALQTWETELRRKAKLLDEKEATQNLPPQTSEACPWDHVEEDMKGIKGMFTKSHQQMQSLRDQIRALDETIRKCEWGAVEDLCEMHRRLESLNIEEARWEAEYLAMILKKHYQLQPIDPPLGSPYLDTCHERLSNEFTGEYVVRCFSKGWQKDGIVVSKALVGTADI